MVIKIENTRQTLRIHTMTSRGEVFGQSANDLTFIVPGFIDSGLAQRCWSESAELDQIAFAARLRVLKKCQEFERALEGTYNSVARTINKVYPRFKSPDASEWGQVTTMQVTRMLDPRPNAPLLTLLAVHRHLMNDSVHFVADPRSHRMTHTFRLRPQHQVDNYKLVTSWIRSNDEKVKAFATDAQKVIDISRDVTHNSFGEPPSKASIPLQAYPPSHLSIIQFLQYAIRPNRDLQVDPYTAFAPLLIKRVERYDTVINADVIRLFLVEIGVFAPWEDIIPGKVELNIQYPSISRLAVKQPAKTPTREIIDDPLDSIRHDFGALPVYVIDDATAEELDDGLSYEVVPNEPDLAWVHVHIADPTAYVNPEDQAARKARLQTRTAYFLHNFWPMLPPDLAHAGLARNDEPLDRARQQKVMTFSFKVDEGGHIIEYKIRPGVVRNLITIPYDHVDAFLGIDRRSSSTYPFQEHEGHRATTFDLKPLESHRKSLEGLWEVAQRLTRPRKLLPIFAWSLPRVALSLKSGSLLTHPASTSPIVYRGFPSLTYEVRNVEWFEGGSKKLVAEYMKAAARVASRFFSDHQIPMLRRGMHPMRVESPEALENLLSSRDALQYVNAIDAVKAEIIAKPGYYSLGPVGHWQLGIPDGEGYVRVTSPLRRYLDMVAHWQIKYALKPSAFSSMPFPPSKLEKIAVETSRSDINYKRAEDLQLRQWAHIYIKRYMDEQNRLHDGKNLQMLEEMDAVVLANPVYDLQINRRVARSYLPSLGIPVRLGYKTKDDYPIGSVVKVRTSLIDTSFNPYYLVEPLS